MRLRLYLENVLRNVSHQPKQLESFEALVANQVAMIQNLQKTNQDLTKSVEYLEEEVHSVKKALVQTQEQRLLLAREVAYLIKSNSSKNYEINRLKTEVSNLINPKMRQLVNQPADGTRILLNRLLKQEKSAPKGRERDDNEKSAPKRTRDRDKSDYILQKVNKDDSHTMDVGFRERKIMKKKALSTIPSEFATAPVSVHTKNEDKGPYPDSEKIGGNLDFLTQIGVEYWKDSEGTDKERVTSKKKEVVAHHKMGGREQIPELPEKSSRKPSMKSKTQDALPITNFPGSIRTNNTPSRASIPEMDSSHHHDRKSRDSGGELSVTRQRGEEIERVEEEYFSPANSSSHGKVTKEQQDPKQGMTREVSMMTMKPRLAKVKRFEVLGIGFFKEMK